MKSLKGFTLVEIMVTIVIAGILLAIGIPSLTSLYEGSRANSNVDKIHSILTFARNQAITYGTTVTVEKLSASSWGGGIKVTLIDTAGKSQTLKVIDAFNTQDKVSGPTSIAFTPDGLSSTGDMIYCPNGEATSSKSVSVSESGLVSYGTAGKSCS
jgi:type IV fimbrial biogenesis protein FimU